MFQLILFSVKQQWFMELSYANMNSWQDYSDTFYYFIPFIGLLIPLASAYRLANFNIDERQTSSFIGLPTPALAIFVLSLPLILQYSNQQFFIDLILNKYVLIIITLLGSYLLNAEIPLFSLKFKNYSWGENKVKYIFLILTLILLISLKTVAIPLVIILYVSMSIIDNSLSKNKSKDF